MSRDDHISPADTDATGPRTPDVEPGTSDLEPRTSDPRRRPPRLSFAILSRLAHGIERDYLLGDLEESFHRRADADGPRAARGWYRRQALFALPGLAQASTQWSLIMLFNYIKLTFRNLRRQKAHGAINILGLAVGLASCLLITLYITSELAYDNFHERTDEVYRVNWDYSWEQMEGVGSGTPPPLAARLKEDFPEVSATTRVHAFAPTVVRYEDRFFVEDRIRAVDSNFFDLFSFEVVAGDVGTMLSAPQAVVLTESAAARYFPSSLQQVAASPRPDGPSSPRQVAAGNDRGTPGREATRDSGPGTWDSIIGQPLTIGEATTFQGRPYDPEYTVTGIVADPPSNSHIEFDILTSIEGHYLVEYFDWSWIWMNVVTYAALEPGTSIPDLEAKITDMVAVHAPDAFARLGFSYDEMIAAGGRWNFVFQPLPDVYLGSANIGNRLGPLGNRDYLNVFGIVAAFVLLIACINFMNLSTARAATRAKEIGVRKTLGSRRAELAKQFFTETAVFASIATVLAVVMAIALLGPFGRLAGRVYQLSHISYQGAPLWVVGPLFLLGVVVVVGLLAGAYPSLYLSSFKPIETLKGKFQGGKASGRFRNGLVVFQFAISIALICCTLIIQSQISYFTNSDLGFERDNVVVISNHNGLLGGQLETFRDLAAAQPGIASAATTTGVPPYWGFQDYYRAEGLGDEQVELISYSVDNHFMDAMGIELVAGRGFSDEFGSDSANVVLNETAARRLMAGFDDGVIGHRSSGSGEQSSGSGHQSSVNGELRQGATGSDSSAEGLAETSPPSNQPVHRSSQSEDGSRITNNPNLTDVLGRTIEYPGTAKYEVIGVVRDFNFASHHQPITPFALFHESSNSYQIPDSYVVARVTPGSESRAIAALEDLWGQMAPGIPISYSFLDDNFADAYVAEQRLGTLLWIFAGLAMLIACLGLFGLAAFTVERRTKEIGLRRTLGASVPSVVGLLSRDFAKFVILANLIAWPAAWFAMHSWLEDFAYQIDIGIGVFVLAGLAALVIALLTVGRQTVGAALADPVKALRYE